MAPPTVPPTLPGVDAALVQVVLDGGGLPEVAAAVVALLGGAAVVTTQDGRVLAEAGAENDLVAARASGCFDPSGRLRTEAQPPGLSSHPGSGANHVLARVEAGRTDHGRIVVFSAQGRLRAGDVPAVERAATVAALAITKQLAVRAVESKYQGDFLRELLAGHVDPDVAVSRAVGLGWDVDRPAVVLVAHLEPGPGAAAGPVPGASGPTPDADAPPPPGPDGRLVPRPVIERFTAAWQAVVRPRDPRAPVVGSAREVVAVLGVPDHRDVRRLVRELVREVAGDGGGGRRAFVTGVGRTAGGPADLREAHEQALTAVRVARRMRGAGAVAHFDDLGVHRLLSLVDARELRAFAEHTLGSLATTGGPPARRQEAADLRRTLEVLLEVNLNVAEAARVLHFHYNTLRYRIAKLERLVGPFGQDPQLRLSLEVALQVLRLREG